MGLTDWAPSAQLAALRQRAQALAAVRRFFAERGLLEVETPLLASAAATDIQLQSFAVLPVPSKDTRAGEAPWRYLPTSPEFAMKRLLAANSGSIYQIARAFRPDEQGRYHNPEFTLLEWYRVDFDDHRLMIEVADLVRSVLQALGSSEAVEPARLSYRQLWRQLLDLDPLTCSAADLAAWSWAQPLAPPDLGADLDGWRDFIMTHHLEPKLAQQGFCFIYDYPASQAALARLRPSAEGDQLVAARFELYWRGVELANGFWELTDPQEQRARFLADNAERARRGLPIMPLDERLLAAMTAPGLPDCSGVALGFDRLLMLALGCRHIGEVMAFADDRA